MTEQHPITPTPELIRQWNEEAATAPMPDQRFIANKAARWGADQELEACCGWLIANDNPRWAVALQEGRRPKPPSTKEQALAVLDDLRAIDATHYNILRNALEQLDDN